MKKLIWYSTSNGFCRVYYKNKETGGLLCYQMDDYRGKKFNLYSCSKDGEPSYKLDISKYKPERPEGDIAIERELIEFLNR